MTRRSSKTAPLADTSNETSAEQSSTKQIVKQKPVVRPTRRALITKSPHQELSVEDSKRSMIRILFGKSGRTLSLKQKVLISVALRMSFAVTVSSLYLQAVPFSKKLRLLQLTLGVLSCAVFTCVYVGNCNLCLLKRLLRSFEFFFFAFEAVFYSFALWALLCFSIEGFLFSLLTFLFAIWILVYDAFPVFVRKKIHPPWVFIGVSGYCFTVFSASFGLYKEVCHYRLDLGTRSWVSIEDISISSVSLFSVCTNAGFTCVILAARTMLTFARDPAECVIIKSSFTVMECRTDDAFEALDKAAVDYERAAKDVESRSRLYAAETQRRRAERQAKRQALKQETNSAIKKEAQGNNKKRKVRKPSRPSQQSKRFFTVIAQASTRSIIVATAGHSVTPEPSTAADIRSELESSGMMGPPLAFQPGPGAANQGHKSRPLVQTSFALLPSNAQHSRTTGMSLSTTEAAPAGPTEIAAANERKGPVSDSNKSLTLHDRSQDVGSTGGSSTQAIKWTTVIQAVTPIILLSEEQSVQTVMTKVHGKRWTSRWFRYKVCTNTLGAISVSWMCYYFIAYFLLEHLSSPMYVALQIFATIHAIEVHAAIANYRIITLVFQSFDALFLFGEGALYSVSLWMFYCTPPAGVVYMITAFVGLSFFIIYDAVAITSRKMLVKSYIIGFFCLAIVLLLVQFGKLRSYCLARVLFGEGRFELLQAKEMPPSSLVAMPWRNTTTADYNEAAGVSMQEFTITRGATALILIARILYALRRRPGECMLLRSSVRLVDILVSDETGATTAAPEVRDRDNAVVSNAPA